MLNCRIEFFSNLQDKSSLIKFAFAFVTCLYFNCSIENIIHSYFDQYSLKKIFEFWILNWCVIFKDFIIQILNKLTFAGDNLYFNSYFELFIIGIVWLCKAYIWSILYTA